MEPAEDWPRQDPMAHRQAMTISLLRNRRRYRLRNAWSEASVGPPAIVMRDPFVKQSTKMLFSDRNYPIEALAPNRADQPFAIGICLRYPHGRLQHRQTQRTDGTIDAFGIDGVAVVNDPSIGCSPDTAIRNCCALHSAVGWSVTFQCRIRRVPTSNTTNT